MCFGVTDTPALRPYQEEDVAFLSSMRCAACFNEQRTGKTPTILAVLRRRRLRKVLILCPASALYMWKDAFEYWNGKPCVVIAGTRQQQRKAMTNWTYGAVISYDLFKLVRRKDRVTGLVDEVLAHKPEAVIADEAHRFRNPDTATALAVFRSSSVPARYALTGTPVLNAAPEIYSILHWLFPAEYRGYWPFCHTFFHVHHEKKSITGEPFKVVDGFKPMMDLALQKILAQFSTQRKRKEVMAWLPAKDHQPIRLPITQHQRRYIDELEKMFETEHVITQGVLDRLLRIRQICLDPGILGLQGESPKAEWLKDFLQDYPDKPILVFSKFTTWLKILADHTNNNGLIVGETPKKTRHQYVQEFQQGKRNVLFIQIDAGKEALTLDRAEAIVFTDQFPPVGDIQQAEDRFVATTMAGADKPHTIYQLMMAGTYEERMHKMLSERAMEIDIINDYRRYLQERSTHGRIRTEVSQSQT